MQFSCLYIMNKDMYTHVCILISVDTNINVYILKYIKAFELKSLTPLPFSIQKALEHLSRGLAKQLSYQ